MYSSRDDVTGGFKKTIDEQKAIKEGKVTVSLFTFNEKVEQKYLGVDINDIEQLHYSPDGMTAMNDGIGTAIDKVGEWLYEKDKRGAEMPGKTLVVVMTDGLENASKEYTLKQVQDKIKEQTDKYSWEFIYMGTDITTSKAADTLGFKFKTYGSRSKFANNYNIVDSAVKCYRSMASTGASLADTTLAFCSTLSEEATKNTSEYEAELGKKISTD
jgi:uncharacterized protein YegL